MGTLRKYRRKERTTITAVRVDRDTEGFTYKKWGGTQCCKAGDWIVNNASDTYTIDADAFAKTYREVSVGVYEKQVSIWAERAEVAGVIRTKEGSTAYETGDMIVFNDTERTEGYAMSAKTFESLYEPVEPADS